MWQVQAGGKGLLVPCRTAPCVLHSRVASGELHRMTAFGKGGMEHI